MDYPNLSILVVRLPGKLDEVEVLVQGDASSLAMEFLMENYGVPKACIELQRTKSKK